MQAQRLPWLTTLLIAVLVTGAPLGAAELSESVDTASITGKITAGESQTAVVDVTVMAYHLSSAQVYRSGATDAKGRYTIAELPHGYYDLAIETADGLFVGTQVLNVPPHGDVVANLQLIPTSAAEQGPRDFPGSDRAATGIAQAVKGSRKALAIGLGAGGGAVALALLLGGSDSTKSRSTP